MNIYLLNADKRINSLKRPSGGTSKDVKLKEDTSIYNPTFILKDTYVVYNYLIWEDRYYFIEDIVSIAYSLHEIHCVMDYLATYRDEILKTRCFVQYSSSEYDSGFIDSRLSSNDLIIDTTVSVPLGLARLAPEQRYILSYLGKETEVGYIALDKTNLDTVVDSLTNEDFLQSLTEVYQRYITNVGECLLDCRYMPLTSIGGIKTVKLIGGFEPGAYGYYINRDIVTSQTIEIPWHFNDFRNRSPFNQMILILPGYGPVELDCDNFIGKESIEIRESLDCATGDVTYLIDDMIHCTGNISVGVPINTSYNGSGLAQYAQAAVSAVGAVAAFGLSKKYTDVSDYNHYSSNQGALGYGIQAISSAVSGILASKQNHLGTAGSNGGLSEFNLLNTNIILTLKSHNTNVEPSAVNTLMGRPLYDVRTLSELSGYVETAGASVACNAPLGIMSSINTMLNRGVYIE